MWIDPNHTEPSNEELGIKPWPKTVMYALVIGFGVAFYTMIWFLFA